VGIWAGAFVGINHVYISSVTRFSDHRQFDVNAEKESLKAPVKP